MPGAGERSCGIEVDEQVVVDRPDREALLVEPDEGVERLRVLVPAEAQDVLLGVLTGGRRGAQRGEHRGRPAPAPLRAVTRIAFSSGSSVRPSGRGPRLRPRRPPGSWRPRRAAPRSPSGIVAMFLPWPTGTFAIAGIPSGPTSSSSSSSIDRRDSGPSGRVCACRFTFVPITRPAAPSSLPARIRWLSRVSIRYSSVFRSSIRTMQPSVSTSNGVPIEALSSVRQPPASGASRGAAADGQHVGVVGVVEDAPERLRPERAVEPVLGLRRQLVLLAREAKEVRAVEGDPAGVRRRGPGERGDVAEAADDPRVADGVPVDQVGCRRARRSRRRARGPCRCRPRSAPTAGRRRAARRCRRGSRGPRGGSGRTRHGAPAPRSRRRPARSPSASAAGSPARRRRWSRPTRAARAA